MSNEVIDAELLDRIGKFIRLFASDKDGEVLASVRAMGRVLANNGFTFNSLADLLKSDIADLLYNEGYDDGYKKGLKKGKALKADDEPFWRDMLEYCHDHVDSDRLNDKERNFIFDLYKQKGTPSERQIDWLGSLYRRLHRPRRPE